MSRDRCRVLWVAASLAGALLGVAGSRPVFPQSITYDGKGVHLADVLAHLEERTGYEFIPQSLGPEIETARKDFVLKDVPLAQTLETVSRSFGVEFFSLDSTGFRVTPLKPWDGGETPAGPYRVRIAPPSANSDADTATMALLFMGKEEQELERISHLGDDFRIVDNFGRPLLDPATLPRRSASQARVQLLEYRQRLLLTLPDQRAVRIRSIKGSLVRFRKVTPLRIAVPLDSTAPKNVKQEGVDIEVEPFRQTGRNLTVTSRVITPEGMDLVGRGLSREIKPYLEDADGRVYRHFTSRVEREAREGMLVREQSSRFERLEGKPANLVFDLWVREDPSERLPFRLPGVALPDRFGGSEPKPEQRPFYHKDGGTLVLQVLDRAGKPIEGEVTLGIARKAGGAPVRWIEAVTDPAGKVRIEQFAPGAYRVTRLFRLAPGAKALTDGRGPVEVTVTAKKDALLPPLKVPALAPED
jgi:hypothetical protein